MSRGQDRLHNFQGPVQNENAESSEFQGGNSRALNKAWGSSTCGALHSHTGHRSLGLGLVMALSLKDLAFR